MLQRVQLHEGTECSEAMPNTPGAAVDDAAAAILFSDDSTDILRTVSTLMLRCDCRVALRHGREGWRSTCTTPSEMLSVLKSLEHVANVSLKRTLYLQLSDASYISLPTSKRIIGAASCAVMHSSDESQSTTGTNSLLSCTTSVLLS
jgi:hypothetical protein